jgi:carbonyl reductase 1
MMISPIAAAFATQTGRIALVTGANKGIGFCIAVQLALSGLFSHIVLGCRDPTRGDAAVSRIQAQLNTISPPSASCTTISYLPLTLGDKQSHQQLRKSLEEQFGKVDVLINNAAMAYKGADPTPHEEQCKPTLDVNFRGTVDLTEELLPLLRLGNDARVVNVASMAGRLRQLRSSQLRSKFTSPELTMEELQSYVDQYERDVLDGTYQQKGWGGSNYGMSKLAVIAATRIWAREEAEHGIKVNCCCPGYCDTDMTSHRGTRSPEDGARNAVIPATMEHAPTGQFFQNYEVSNWIES